MKLDGICLNFNVEYNDNGKKLGDVLSSSDFMRLNCIPIYLSSPEISFAPLKLNLRVKWGRRRSGGMSQAIVFKT